MKRFLIRFFIITLLFAFIVVSAYKLSDYYLNLKKRDFLKLNEKISIVFAGDSNMECAVNDSLIPNSINIAESGEAYMYTYAKIKTLLEINPQVKTLYLAFALHDISKSVENTWMFDSEFIIVHNSYYNYLLNKQDKYLLFSNNPKAYLEAIRDCIVKNVSQIIISRNLTSFNKEKIQFGGYVYLGKGNLKKAIIKQSLDTTQLRIANYQLKYLKDISEFCQKKSVNLVLLNTPKYKLANDQKYDLTSFIQTNKDIFLNTSFLDYSRMALPDSDFADLMHLNHHGAKAFSTYLKRVIQ